MLIKKTSKNRITLPKKILKEIPQTAYFDVSLREGAVVLRPVTEPGSRLATIRQKIRALGIEPKDIDRAIRSAVLQTDPKFWKLIHARRKQPTRSLAQVKDRFRRPK